MQTLREETATVTYPYSLQVNIRWGAILGGWIVATAVALLLYAVGAALGITVIQVTDMDALSKKSIVLTGFWLLITWAVALYFGGLFASRGVRDSSLRTGSFHAIGVWAVSKVLTIMLGVGGVGVTGLTGIMAAGQAAEAAGNSLVAAGPFVANAVEKQAPHAPADFQAAMKNSIAGILNKRGAIAANAQETTGGNNQNINQALQELDAETLVAISADFLRGDKAAAKNSLAVNTSLSGEEADRVVNSLSA